MDPVRRSKHGVFRQVHPFIVAHVASVTHNPSGTKRPTHRFAGVSPWDRPQIPLDITSTIHYLMVVDQLDTTFAALSDPTRRAMVHQLASGPASVHRLTASFDVSQQMISKHIATLVRARIVTKTKHGRESVCTLRPEAIKTVSNWAADYRRFWEESFSKLDAVVNQMKRDGEK